MASIRTVLGWSAAISLIAMSAVAVIGCETDELPDGLTFQLPDGGSVYVPPGANYDAASSPDAQQPGVDATASDAAVSDATPSDATASDATGDVGSPNDSGSGGDAGSEAGGGPVDSGGLDAATQDSGVIFDASFDGFSLDKDADIKN